MGRERERGDMKEGKMRQEESWEEKGKKYTKRRYEKGNRA